MKPNFRLFDPGRLTGAQQMALDDIMLDEVAQRTSPPTLRFFQFSNPVVLVGRHQRLDEDVDEQYCHRQGIEINRRVTGGGALYWQPSSLGWEVVARQGEVPFRCGRETIQRRLCTAAAAALHPFGAHAAFRPRNDIEVDGRKIGGSGGCFEGASFLYQGTVLIHREADGFLNALKQSTLKLKKRNLESMLQRICFLDDFCKDPVDVEAVKQALAHSLAAELDIDFNPSGLTPSEERRLHERLPGFQSDSWIRGDAREMKRTEVLSSQMQYPAGMVQIHLWADERTGIVQRAWLVGDFFCSPARFGLDMEAALTGCKATSADIERCLREFYVTHPGEIQDIPLEDILKLCNQALLVSKRPVTVGRASARERASLLGQR